MKSFYNKLIECTRLSHELPDNDDHKYYSSHSTEYIDQVKKIRQKLLNNINNISEFLDPSGRNIRDNIINISDVSEQYKFVTDVVDLALEKVDIYIDRMKGYGNNDKNININLNNNNNNNNNVIINNDNIKKKISKKSLNLIKPQKKFMDIIDNSHQPFIPRLIKKLNAKVQLQSEIIEAQNMNIKDNQLVPVGSPPLNPKLAAHLAGMEHKKKSNKTHLPHPYQYELDNIEYTSKQLGACREKLFHNLDEHQYYWIDTEQKLNKLANKLQNVSEFALDLEHHSYRSYQGFVCLAQISTRDDDYIIDTLKLRHHMYVLGDVLSNPKIVKVLHGADHDIVWLQRDFGLYIVNMFDTGQASRVLGFSKYSLSYLIKHYCDVILDKKYQLADWRQRPLSKEMLEYARKDTHYLLYIYDRLRNEAVQKSSSTIFNILSRSRDICLKRYEKPIVDDADCKLLCQKYGLMYTNIQMNVMKALYVWRDELARKLDESVLYILPNRALINLCNTMPCDIQSVAQVLNGINHLKSYYNTIGNVILDARNTSILNQDDNQLDDMISNNNKNNNNNNNNNNFNEEVQQISSTYNINNNNNLFDFSPNKRSKINNQISIYESSDTVPNMWTLTENDYKNELQNKMKLANTIKESLGTNIDIGEMLGLSKNVTDVNESNRNTNDKNNVVVVDDDKREVVDERNDVVEEIIEYNPIDTSNNKIEVKDKKVYQSINEVRNSQKKKKRKKKQKNKIVNNKKRKQMELATTTAVIESFDYTSKVKEFDNNIDKDKNINVFDPHNKQDNNTKDAPNFKQSKGIRANLKNKRNLKSFTYRK